MPSPFPGMDPYFEANEIWKGFHHFLADEIAAQLNPLVGPRYFADVEIRTISEDVLIATTQTVYPDADVVLDLGAVLRSVYTRAGYDWRIDYRRPVPPPELRSEMVACLGEVGISVK